MRLADRIAQCCSPLVVQSAADNTLTHLNGPDAFAGELAACPVRYVLSDDLTRLCTALAYSKGANTLACRDFLHVPAERVWIEWCNAPWSTELSQYGFKNKEPFEATGRRGVLIQSSPNGRCGFIRAFWSKGEEDTDVLASSMEAFFDFDTPDGAAPTAPDFPDRPAVRVFDHEAGQADILRQCFRFRYETTWAEYYANAALTPLQQEQLARHALGTIAIAIPVTLAFFLLLATRPGLPRRQLMLERLNRARMKSGKQPLLEHIEVCSPLQPEYSPNGGNATGMTRRPSRLHHVRGHLFRRGSHLFWRVPHLRGSARAGIVRSRTVTWTIDRPEHRGQSNGAASPDDRHHSASSLS